MTTAADLLTLSPADRYVWMATTAIKLAYDAGGITTADDLRDWWRSQQRHRNDAEISPEQEETLVQLCRSTIGLIGEDPREQPKPRASQPARRRSRRRAAI